MEFWDNQKQVNKRHVFTHKRKRNQSQLKPARFQANGLEIPGIFPNSISKAGQHGYKDCWMSCRLQTNEIKTRNRDLI